MPNGVGIGAAAGEQPALRRRVAGDAVAGAGEIFAARRRASAAAGCCCAAALPAERQSRRAPRRRRQEREPGIVASSVRLAAAGERQRVSCPSAPASGFGGAGRDASQAATALTSSSVRWPATTCMQSGRDRGPRAVAPGAELGADVGRRAGRAGRGSPGSMPVRFGPVAARAGRNAARGVALVDQGLAARQHVRADVGRRRRRTAAAAARRNSPPSPSGRLRAGTPAGSSSAGSCRRPFRKASSWL